MKRFKELILNPVENLPYLLVEDSHANLRGLYITDKSRNSEAQQSSINLFGGRETQINTINNIYANWASQLGAEELSLKPYSGLHAHIITFMSIGRYGDKILLLPTIAGGHHATKNILQRLGYDVIDMAVDRKNLCIDHKETQRIIAKEKPKYIFVDRSEGLNYEDFSDIIEKSQSFAIFDASQYLANIICHDMPSPFSMGFNMILSSIHKNFPGPQKALICTNDKKSSHWKSILNGLSAYVSNTHPENIYMAGDIIQKTEILRKYSKLMIENSVYLEQKLRQRFVSIVPKKDHFPTHHLWIKFLNKKAAFQAYKKLESFNLLVNYRYLPYDLGYGIRMGTSAATLQGLRPEHMDKLAWFIQQILAGNESNSLKSEVSEFIELLEPMNESLVL